MTELTRRKRSRLIAPMLLLASLSLTVLPENWGYLFSPFLALAFVFLVLWIVSAILARQWIFVGVVWATIAGVVGLGAILLLSRHSPAPEAAAVANLRTINTAQVTYLSLSGGTYGSITDLIAAKLLDETFTSTKAGYRYSITLGAKGLGYTAEAVPILTDTGLFGYYSHPDAVVRFDDHKPCSRRASRNFHL